MLHFSIKLLSWLFPLWIWWLLCSLISSGNSSPSEKASQCCTLSKNPDDVEFLLYPDSRNSKSFDDIKFDNVHSLTESRFQMGLRTILITHGYNSNASSMACQLIKNELLGINVMANVIIVNWGQLSTPNGIFINDYDMIVKNVPIVGKRVAEFVVFLEEHGNVGLDDFYLIGHSMGAHVMGVAGKGVSDKTGQQVGRITGLDPAGPGFYFKKPETNLMKENAKFIDVIHTNMGQLGDMTRDGQADFYPNGGRTQPSCIIHSNVYFPSLPGNCSHLYAYILYAATITKNYPACPCDSEAMDYSHKCPKKCVDPVPLGFHCPSTAKGTFYLSTEILL